MNQNLKTALIIGGIILALVVVVPLIGGGGWGMMGGFGMMGLGMIVFWGLVIWLVVALARGVGQPGGSDYSSSRPDSALEVLKKRYARGEISREEYEDKKKDLA